MLAQSFKDLSTKTLRSFVTVVELGSFTQASELLCRSQPAISLQIKQLEESLSLTLFVRNGKRLSLTPSGEVLFDYAKRILALNDEVTARFDSNSIAGRLRFGIPSEFATTLLPKIVSRFILAHPNVTLEVNCDLSKNLLLDINKNRYDLILALHDNSKSVAEDADKEYIKTEKLVWVSSPDHDMSKHQTLPLIVAPEGCIYRNRGIQQLKSHNIDWRIVYTITDLSGIQAAIEEGLGVTILTKNTVPKNLKIMPTSAHFPELGDIGISLVSRNRSQIIEKLSNYLKAHLT